jgi:hypothetical protein
MFGVRWDTFIILLANISLFTAVTWLESEDEQFDIWDAP